MLKFEVYKAANEYYFKVTAGADPILLSSEGSKQKENVLKNIEAVKKNAPVPSSIEKGETSTGDYFFTLSDSCGKVVCKSTMFYSSLERDKWLNDIQKELPQVDVIEA